MVSPKLHVNRSPGRSLEKVRPGQIFFAHLSKPVGRGLSGRVNIGSYVVKASGNDFYVNPLGTSTVYHVRIPENYRIGDYQKERQTSKVTSPIKVLPSFNLDDPRLTFTELNGGQALGDIKNDILTLTYLTNLQYPNRIRINHSISLKSTPYGGHPDLDRKY